MPIAAPSVGAPPGGFGNAPGSPGSFPRPGLPPVPSSPPAGIPPSIPPSGFRPPIPAPALPGLRPPAIPVAPVPAAPGFRPPGGGLGGALFIPLVLELLFPPPVAAPEAPPGVDPGASPLQQPPAVYPPVTEPPGGIRPDGVYRSEVTYKTTPKDGTAALIRVSGTNTSGANLLTTMRAQTRTYTYSDAFNVGTVLGFSITLVTAGTQPVVKPDYPSAQLPTAFIPPLQQPFPIDIKGVPSPQYPPMVFPQPAPERLPAPKVNPPIVQPETPPERKPAPIPFPPIFEPFSPPYPLTIPTVVPQPQKVPTPAPAPQGIPLITINPIEGFINPPETEKKVPPIVVPTERQQGADCCYYPAKKGEECDLEPVLKLLKEIKECACPPDRTTSTATLGQGDSGSFSLPADSLQVILTVTQRTDQVRSQSGNAGGQNIYYLGSYSFGSSGRYGDRMPVSFMSSVFQCRERDSNFQYQLNFGSVATVEVVYLNPVPPV